MKRCLMILVLACATCGPPAGGRSAGTVEGSPMPVDTPAKMRHQIMVRYGNEVQVFEGYMIRGGNAFLVRAFAGPGVDLFTVARDGKRHREEAHISALEERLDLEAVSMDIARAYLGGCEKPEGTKAECTLLGEPMIEEFDELGRLVARRFPEAHGIGMRIVYEEYDDYLDGQAPWKIVLEWGEGKNRMVIKLLSVEAFSGSVEEVVGL